MRKFRQEKRSTDWFAELWKVNVIAEKRPDRPKRTLDEELMDDRKRLADPQNRSEWRVCLRGILVYTLVEKRGFKMDVMMIMMMMIIETFNILLYKVLNGKHRGCH